MNKIKTILICLIIIFVTCAFCTGLFLMNEQTTTIKLSETCTIGVRGTVDLNNIGNGISQLKINNLFGEAIIYHFNSENKGANEVLAFAALKTPLCGNTFDTGANPIQTTYNGQTVYICYTSNNITHDNILIISKNRDDCIKMYNSIKYNTKQVNNTTNTTVEKLSNNTDNSQQQNTTNAANGYNSEELRKMREDSFNSGRSYQSYLDSRNNKPTPSPSPSPLDSSR